MDFVIELVVQFIVEFVVEIIGGVLLERGFAAVADVLGSRTGRRVVTVAVGLAFGLVWGAWLADRPHPPKLLWASLALAAAALALLVRSRAADRGRIDAARRGFVREAFSWPWHWPSRRLVDLTLLNLAIAGGVAGGYWFG